MAVSDVQRRFGADARILSLEILAEETVIAVLARIEGSGESASWSAPRW